MFIFRYVDVHLIYHHLLERLFFIELPLSIFSLLYLCVFLCLDHLLIYCSYMSILFLIPYCLQCESSNFFPFSKLCWLFQFFFFSIEILESDCRYLENAFELLLFVCLFLRNCIVFIFQIGKKSCCNNIETSVCEYGMSI